MYSSTLQHNDSESLFPINGIPPCLVRLTMTATITPTSIPAQPTSYRLSFPGSANDTFFPFSFASVDGDSDEACPCADPVASLPTSWSVISLLGCLLYLWGMGFDDFAASGGVVAIRGFAALSAPLSNPGTGVFPGNEICCMASLLLLPWLLMLLMLPADPNRTILCANENVFGAVYPAPAIVCPLLLLLLLLLCA